MTANNRLASRANAGSPIKAEQNQIKALATDAYLRPCDRGWAYSNAAPLPLEEHRGMPNKPNPRGVLPETGYIRQSRLIPAIFPFSSATLWRKVKAGTFPQPVKLGPRITAWRVEDIRGLIERLGR
jgi:prophage regulatory protein